MKNKTNSLMNAIRELVRPPLEQETCCVPRCQASSPLLVVAGQGAAKTVMCLTHARRWVDSDGCRRGAENIAGGIESTLAAWTSVVGRETTPPAWQPGLRSL
jgi:hypothetical protein